MARDLLNRRGMEAMSSTTTQTAWSVFSTAAWPTFLYLTEREIRLEVLPGNEGPMAVLGREPVLLASRIRAFLHRENGKASLTAEIDPAGLRVISLELAEADRRRVLEQVQEKVLAVAAFPQIRFECPELRAPEAGGALTLRGTLTLRGVTRPVPIRLARDDERTLTGEARLLQTDFGIAPLTAFMGALRSRDEVRIRIRIRLP
jgi:hypothetical protein